MKAQGLLSALTGRIPEDSNQVIVRATQWVSNSPSIIIRYC
jgi:hypothetical protein